MIISKDAEHASRATSVNLANEQYPSLYRDLFTETVSVRRGRGIKCVIRVLHSRVLKEEKGQ